MKLAAFGLVLAAAGAAPACALLGNDGKPVPITTEKVVLVWDEKNKTEHFIRSAQFASRAADLGFLVPLPSAPVIEEVKPALFHLVADALKNAVTGGHPSPPGTTQVESTQFVSGYEATVLNATSEADLLKWLASNGYPSAPALKDWLGVYVKKGYRIVAFKYAGTENGRFETRPVRLTFKTDQLYYPYREPATDRTVLGREWSAYVLAETYMKAKLSNGGAFRGVRKTDSFLRDWETAWLTRLLSQPEGSLSRLTKLSLFTDNSELPREQADLIFAADK